MVSRRSGKKDGLSGWLRLLSSQPLYFPARCGRPSSVIKKSSSLLEYVSWFPDVAVGYISVIVDLELPLLM
jgi:hypothetical protein